MNNWSEVLLKDICDITRGASPRPIHDFMTEDLDGIPWVKIRDATASNTRFIENTKGFIKKEGKNKSVSVISGDLIVSNSATPGLPKIMGIDACIHDGWLLLRNLNGVCKEFLFYLLINDRKQIVSQGTGTIFTNLKTDILKNHQIKLPPISEQEEIASFLGSVDDKIDLNQKMNETLEEIAKTLFKSWFIDFDPVRAKAEGRSTGLSKEISDLFPDAFEDSELGEIPKGWRCSSISSKYDFLSGFAFKSKDWIEEGVPVVKIKSIDSGIVDLDTDTFVSEDFIGTKSSYILNEGDILIAMTGATIGKVGVVPISTKKSLLNQRVGKFIHRDNLKNFFLNCFVSSRLFLKNIENLATGSARDNISKDQILSIKTIIPTDDIYNKFGELTEDIRKKILIANNENNILEKLRDALLPKLISGELQIPDAENLVEEAGI